MDPTLALILFLLIVAVFAYFRYINPTAAAATTHYRERRRDRRAGGTPRGDGARGWWAGLGDDVHDAREWYRDRRDNGDGDGAGAGAGAGAGDGDGDGDGDKPARPRRPRGGRGAEGDPGSGHDTGDDPDDEHEDRRYRCDFCRDHGRVPGRGLDGELVSLPCPLCTPAEWKPSEPGETRRPGYWVRAERIYPEPASPAAIGESPRGLPTGTEPSATTTDEPAEPQPLDRTEPAEPLTEEGEPMRAIGTRTNSSPATTVRTAPVALTPDGDISPEWVVGWSDAIGQLLGVVANAVEQTRAECAAKGVRDTNKGKPLATMDRLIEALGQAQHDARESNRLAMEHLDLDDHAAAVSHAGATVYGRRPG